MTEWWTYGLPDFLMFSPQAYWRLVARYNAAWWPGQVLGVLASFAVIALLRRPHVSPRAVLLLLALAWAWVGWAFHWQRYSEIFLAAPGAGTACFVQAALLAIAAALPAQGERRAAGAPAWVLAIAACAWPLLAPLTGHAWSEAEVFGFMPEPTALLTLAALAAWRGHVPWRRALLAVLPVASLLLGAATRWLIAQ